MTMVPPNKGSRMRRAFRYEVEESEELAHTDAIPHAACGRGRGREEDLGQLRFGDIPRRALDTAG